MSVTERPKPTRMTVCDLCDEEIPDGRPDESGSLTHGWIAHRVEMPRTKRAWLLWPPGERKRRQTWKEQQKPENRERRYDFHADCILRLVENAIEERQGQEKARPLKREPGGVESSGSSSAPKPPTGTSDSSETSDSPPVLAHPSVSLPGDRASAQSHIEPTPSSQHK